MKNLLMISYFYPPLNDVGVLRTIGFAEHLTSFDWKPFILTVKNPDLNFCNLDPNQAFPEQIVYRSRSLVNHFRFAGKLNGLISKIAKLIGVNFENELIRNLLLIPDWACGWIPLTILKGLRIVHDQNIDVIFATCKPNSSGVIGAILSRLTGKPLVIDLRDPWRRGIVQKMVGNRLTNYLDAGERWKDTVDKILEPKALSQASKIILATRETLDVYSKLYPFLRDRLELIHNGYADGFFKDEPQERFDKFTIVYSGSYYYYLDKSEAFFQALANMRDENGLNGKVYFLYVGKSSIISKMIKKYDLYPIANCTGYLGRKEAINLMRRATILLLRNVKPHLSTKIFEGLASGIPFLALTGEGEAGDLIRQYSPSSIIIDEGSSAKQVENAIRAMYRKWTEGKLSYEPKMEFKSEFSKFRLTEKFAKILTNCMENNGTKGRLNA